MSEMSMMTQHPVLAISFLSLLFIFVMGIAVLTIFIIFLIDKSQRKDAISHNYPVLEPRLLKRHHVRMMQANDISVRLDKLYPPPAIIRI